MGLDQRKNNHDIQLIILDIDGTIAGKNNEVSKAVSHALQAAQRKGVHVGIATGRMYRSAQRFHAEVQATVPLCAYQGALIKDPQNNQVLKHMSLDPSLTGQLVKELEEYPLVLHVYINDHLYVREINTLSQDYAERAQVPLKLLSELNHEWKMNPIKVQAMAEDTELIGYLLRNMPERFPAHQLYFTRSTPQFLDAVNPNVNKGEAVRYLAEGLLGLTADQVMTIGDAENDIEMLEYAGIGVAMGNASDNVKIHADWVAPTVEADGVAAAVEEFVL